MIEFKEVVVVKDGQVLNSPEFLNVKADSKKNQLKLRIEALKTLSIRELYIEFSLSQTPSEYRSSSYEWIPFSEEKIVLSSYNAKILKWSDGSKSVASSNLGVWEIYPKTSSMKWFLLHPDLYPSFTYDKSDHRIWHHEYDLKSGQEFHLEVLNTSNEIDEFARTPIGFVPTVCFTDHCDFDTPKLLVKQRKIFKEAGVRTSKGFFLYDQSDRPFLASAENDGILDELHLWEKDGHELVFHAFSKSEGPDSPNHFKSFETPKNFNPVETYIDHGFLSYNSTRQERTQLADWFGHLSNKGIGQIWNYVDAFEATAICNNQLSAFDSSIAAIWASKDFHEEKGLNEDSSRLFKAWLSFGTTEDLDFAFKHLNTSIQKFKKDKVGALPGLSKNVLKTIRHSINSEVISQNLWKRSKPFHFGRFTPLIFKSPHQDDTEVYTFQTASVKNFETSLSEYSLEKLSNEKGVLIAHTYFAYTSPNHTGRLFLTNEGKENKVAVDNFNRLGRLVSSQAVWNPTISEMTDFYKRMEKVHYKLEGDQVSIKNAPGPTRKIS